MVVPCSERNSMWTDTWCKRKGKKAPLPQPTLSRVIVSWSTSLCLWVIIIWTLNMQPWSFSKSPSSVVWTHQRRRSTSPLRPWPWRTEGVHRQHFSGRRRRRGRADDESRRLRRSGTVASPHLWPSTMLHNCATPRSKQSVISKPSKTRAGLPLRHSIYEIAFLLCRGITGKPSTLWHTEEIRRVPLNPRYFRKSTKPLISGDDGGPLSRYIL